MSTTNYVDVNRSLQNLEDAIDRENYQAIQEFIDHQAAEGISDVQQERQIQSFKTLLTKLAPSGFRLRDATEAELKELLANINRSSYADGTKHKFKGTIKKFYKVENGGREHPNKVQFFTVTRKKATPVTRDDLFTEDELGRLFEAFSSTRDRALTKVLYESAARPGEVLSRNIGDFIVNGKGDFISIEGLKNTPDRTNQLIRAGRTIREWLATHPLGGDLGSIRDPSAPLWVKTEQQRCKKCGEIPHHHDDPECAYESDLRDRLKYDAFLRRFKQACEQAEIPENKRRPYNLRHTRLTEVATFMGYEQLNKFAGWKPGSDRAKVYVHLNNDDVNQAIRDEYGLSGEEDETQPVNCSFCGAENQPKETECRTCGRPLSLEKQSTQEEKYQVLERLAELEEKGVLDQLDTFTQADEEE
ncbi:tyrosine-type recombinase/integrase [Natrinema thermotolerans]|uniref:Tyrosine-type recombinase/integrase n=1 Tax=Natrinema thermotolerans TaxID=121872 RepID=A0AAF0PED4_9EURY|nr:tyrosine-type recombinase/integrase [Natrinema thermotolerans]QCC57848.1 integrase [Natrinema thermotolerans]WMT08939.1 tyrosine-type recombinase/integrase [Natrinema thermotolerans]